MSHVVKDFEALTKSFSKSDKLIILGGSNEEIGQAENNYCRIIDKVLSKTTHTNVVVSSLPFRHHTPGLNNRVSFLNIDIERTVSNHEHASFLDFSVLPRHLYTRHGLHFNKQGKRELASMIKEMCCCEKKEKTNVKKRIDQNAINIVEENMWEIIKENKNNSSTAFAHTISNDLNHEKNMTAGIAVIFRRNFGRPQTTDFINSKLTCQAVQNGATIYSLVTKENYYEKPTTKTYDEAFEQFIEEFKKKNFRTLICSPMGCVRDKIQLEHFSRNITKLHQATNATVCIVLGNHQTSNRVLYNGLPHSIFLEQLRENIDNYVRNSATTTISTCQDRPFKQMTTNENPQSPVSQGSVNNSEVLSVLQYSDVVMSPSVNKVQKQSNVKVSKPDDNVTSENGISNASNALELILN